MTPVHKWKMSQTATTMDTPHGLSSHLCQITLNSLAETSGQSYCSKFTSILHTDADLNEATTSPLSDNFSIEQGGSHSALIPSLTPSYLNHLKILPISSTNGHLLGCDSTFAFNSSGHIHVLAPVRVQDPVSKRPNLRFCAPKLNS